MVLKSAKIFSILLNKYNLCSIWRQVCCGFVVVILTASQLVEWKYKFKMRIFTFFFIDFWSKYHLPEAKAKRFLKHLLDNKIFHTIRNIINVKNANFTRESKLFTVDRKRAYYSCTVWIDNDRVLAFYLYFLMLDYILGTTLDPKAFIFMLIREINVN